MPRTRPARPSSAGSTHAPSSRCGSPHPLPLLSDGSHTFFVKAIDAPGNESQIVWRSFTVDTVAPAVTISSGPAEGTRSSDPSPSFGFASNDSDAGLSCQLDGGGFQRLQLAVQRLRPRGRLAHVPGQGNGSGPKHRPRLTHLDRRHHRPGGDVLLRSCRTARSRPIEAPRSASPPTTPAPASAAGSTAAAFDACSSPFSASGLADGSHTFQVRATDTVQNTAVASRTWTVAGPADVSITAGPVSGSVTKDPTPSFSFSSLDSDSDFHCRIDGAAVHLLHLADRRPRGSRTATTPSSSRQWMQPKPPTSPGATFTVDTTAPAVTIKGRRKVRTRRKKASATFTLTASEHADRRCRVDSRRFKPCSWRYRTPKLGRGAHTLKVKATDRVGNVGTERKRFRIARR